ncbi:MAG: hypothetical protein EXS64_20430 [Candidatus Latescibacteria bacterium]|nr:hypothetical protein [Candidatus Latescibacterota bacterium]
MHAGFSRVCINPPKGTRMMGFGDRDRGPGSGSIRDDIFARALYLAHDGEQALIVTFDMCFIGREDSGRYKGVLGRLFGLTPRQIVLASSHSHVGPASGYWAYGDYLPPDQLYLREMEAAVVAAATAAKERARKVTIRAGSGHSKVPMNRRKRMPNGKFENRPNPDGIVCDALPVCLLTGEDGRTVACLFSIAAHPSIVGGTAISSEYPGVATNRVDAHLGAALAETRWPLLPARSRGEFEKVAGELTPGAPPSQQRLYPLWAARQLELLDRGQKLRTAASVLIQGIQLGKGLRMVAIEGEPVAEHGLNMLKFYSEGVTFPLGYANGEAMYLPVTRQLPEGGYEVDSYWEYGAPAGLAPGMEQVVTQTLETFQRQGIG